MIGMAMEKKTLQMNSFEYKNYNKSTTNSSGNHVFNWVIFIFQSMGFIIGALVVTCLLFYGVDIENVSSRLLAIVFNIAFSVIIAIIDAVKH